MGRPAPNPPRRSGSDRRAFFRRSGTAAATLAGVALWPRTGRAAADGIFRHGVASGDPQHDRVVLWTRVTPPEGVTSVAVDFVVARDPGLTDVVRSGRVAATPARDFTVKPDVTGLEPGTTYYEGFAALQTQSPRLPAVGRDAGTRAGRVVARGPGGRA